MFWNHKNISLVMLLALLLSHGASLVSPQPLHATTTEDCPLSWSFAPRLKFPGYPRVLDMVRVSPKIAWAAGSFTRGKYTKDFSARWDGKEWERLPTPNLKGQDNSLVEIAANAPDDVWAVGTSLLHWNGKKWRIVPAPTPAEHVVTFGANDVWITNDEGAHHWDGTTWGTIPPPPLPNPQDRINDMVVKSATEIWALGDSGIGERVIYIGLWDGTQWTVETTSMTGGPDGNYYGARRLLVISPTQMWASGGYGGTLGTYTAIFERDRATWNVLPYWGSLHGTVSLRLAGTEANNLWAISTVPLETNHVLHRDDTGWNEFYLPKQNVQELTGVFVLSQDEVWIAGIDPKGTFLYHNSRLCETAPGKP